MKGIKSLWRLLAFLVVFALLATALPLGLGKAQASPGTIYVPDDYPTIEAAVDAAFFEIPCNIVTSGLLS